MRAYIDSRGGKSSEVKRQPQKLAGVRGVLQGVLLEDTKEFANTKSEVQTSHSNIVNFYMPERVAAWGRRPLAPRRAIAY